MQLLAVVIARGFFDQRPNLANTSLNILVRTGTLHDSRVVFVGRDGAGAAKVTQCSIFQLETSLLCNDLTTRQNGYIFEHGLAAIAKTRSLHCQDIKGAAQLVDY